MVLSQKATGFGMRRGVDVTSKNFPNFICTSTETRDLQSDADAEGADWKKRSTDVTAVTAVVGIKECIDACVVAARVARCANNTVAGAFARNTGLSDRALRVNCTR